MKIISKILLLIFLNSINFIFSMESLIPATLQEKSCQYYGKIIPNTSSKILTLWNYVAIQSNENKKVKKAFEAMHQKFPKYYLPEPIAQQIIEYLIHDDEVYSYEERLNIAYEYAMFLKDETQRKNFLNQLFTKAPDVNPRRFAHTQKYYALEPVIIQLIKENRVNYKELSGELLETLRKDSYFSTKICSYLYSHPAANKSLKNFLENEFQDLDEQDLISLLECGADPYVSYEMLVFRNMLMLGRFFGTFNFEEIAKERKYYKLKKVIHEYK